MKDIKYHGIKPKRIIAPSGEFSFPCDVNGVILLSDFAITVTVENGSYSGPSVIVEGKTATLTVTPIEGYALPDSVTVTGADDVYDSTAGTIVLSNPTGDVSVAVACELAIEVDPVLDNNSWEVIRAVCEAGNAGDYWALGDSKNVTVGSYTYPWTLVHLGNIYGTKKAVFMCGYRTESDIVWDAGNSNNVTTADIWASLASGGTAYNELIDAELGAQLTDTTVQVATSATDVTLTTLTGKLFLPAEKELTATMLYSVAEEFAALTTFGYFAANDTDAARVRHKASAPEATSNQSYWMRSPDSGDSEIVVGVDSNGVISGYSATYAKNGVAPCFAF